MQHRDAELAARAGRGDRIALELLYGRYVERVWRYAWFRTHSREAAADIVQETFLRVAQSAGQFEGRSSLATWLFAVTRSVAIQQGRTDRKCQRRLDDPAILRLVPPSHEAANPLERDDTRQAVRRAVAKLPGAQRDAIVLCELSGWRIREAAEVLGWGESRVKVTLHRARGRLAELLAAYVADRDTAQGEGGN